MEVAALSSPRPQTAPQLVPLLAIDPAFAAAVPEEEREAARRSTAALLIEAGPGPLELPTVPGIEPLCALVIEGLLVRQIALDGRPGAAPLMRGGAFDPVLEKQSFHGLPVALRALTPVRLAILDRRFVAAARRWPELQVTLAGRLLEQVTRGSHHSTICQRRNVEDRVLLLLRHLASALGSEAADGSSELPVDLTHDMIGRLVGAQRPTVTLAFGALAVQNLVTPLPGGGWRLAPASP